MIQKTKTIKITSLYAFFRNIKVTSDLYQAQAINFRLHFSTILALSSTLSLEILNKIKAVAPPYPPNVEQREML